MLKGKKIILCVTGSIAAYKAVFLLRLLKKEQAEVKVIMTESAANFVAPLTFATLSGERVLMNLFRDDEWENHAILARWADLIIIAPATCNTIASMANGFCNNLLDAVYLSATCPVMVAPAMDEDMWAHPTTRRNIQKLIYDKVKVLKVNKGDLASGLSGLGRMCEPEEIMDSVKGFFEETKIFSGKKILITAGPTVERIDPVRYISNDSSGKMGIALAEAFSNFGAKTTLICGPVHQRIPSDIEVHHVTTADEMYNACMGNFFEFDIIIMAAAVADYTPVHVATQKIKKKDGSLTLELQQTKDILYAAGHQKKNNQVVVGFALETENGEENAKKKLVSKKIDFIILNSLSDKGSGFGTDTNKIIIFSKDNSRWEFPLKGKNEVAIDIVKFLSEHS